jgi:hypothetical protein
MFFMPDYHLPICFYSAKNKDSSQLEELVSRVTALQGLSSCALCLHFSCFTSHTYYYGLGEKDTLSSQHQAELQRQKEETARLKEELIS